MNVIENKINMIFVVKDFMFFILKLIILKNLYNKIFFMI